MSGPAFAAPTGAPTPAATGPAPQTFQPNTSGGSQENTLRPIQPLTPNADTPSSDSKTNSSNAPLLQDPQNRTTSGLMGPANVTTAIFFTADRANVFKPAVMETENWGAAAPKFDEGWSSAGGR